MTIIDFDLSCLTIQPWITKLSPYVWWYHCAICTCRYLHFYFAVIYWDIFPCHRHKKKHSHLRCWRCSLLRIVFLIAKVFFLYLPEYVWGLLLHIFEKCTTFSQVLHFLLKAWQGLIKCGWPLHLVYILLPLLAVIFSFGFGNVFLKLYPTSSFTVKGSLHYEELANIIAWVLNCKLLVISVSDLAGFALIPSSSLTYASGSLKPEINFTSFNCSLGLAAVLSISKLQ